MKEREERNWAMFCHFAALSGYLTALGFIIGPLIVWLMKREESEFVDDQGKESLNFQLSLLLYLIISVALTLILIGFLAIIAVIVFQFIMVIIAGIKASKGVRFRYPFTIRFIP